MPSEPSELRALRVLVAHEWRLQRRDLVPQLVLTLMPLLLLAFLLPTYRRALQGLPGQPHVTSGAEQAVPGLAVMFALFLVSYVGMVFFRDHGWNTWSRYRGTSLRLSTLVLGKSFVPLVLVVAQLTVVLGAGRLLLGMRISGSLPALALLVLGWAVCLVALGVLGFAVCRTVVQMTAAANVSALAMAGLGGALVPPELLPGWAAATAPFTPAYWAVHGMRRVTADGAGVADLGAELGALTGFALVVCVLAGLLLRPDHRKVSWA